MDDSQDFVAALSLVGVSAGSFLAAITRTFEQIPPIQSEEQAAKYQAAKDQLDQRWKTHGSSASPDFSKEGMLSTAIGARLIEWEEREDDE